MGWFNHKLEKTYPSTTKDDNWHGFLTGSLQGVSIFHRKIVQELYGRTNSLGLAPSKERNDHHIPPISEKNGKSLTQTGIVKWDPFWGNQTNVNVWMFWGISP